MRNRVFAATMAAGLMIGLAAILSSRHWEPPASPQPAGLGRQAAITDLANREVTLRKPVKRIVLMRGLDLFELAAVLGDDVEDRLVGWDSSLKTGDLDSYQKFVGRYPRLADATVLGDALRDTVSAEAVLALNPDLVVMSSYMREGNSKGLDLIERAGLPLLYLDSRDPFHDPQRSMRLLGQALDRTDRAAQLAAWADAQLKKVFSRLKTLDKPPPSIYIEAGTGGPGRYGNTFGRNTESRAVNWGSMLSQLRCRNIAADAVSGPYGMGVIQTEYLLAANPELIVITGAHWTTFPDSLRLGYDSSASHARTQLRAFTERAGWMELDAVRRQRVYGLHTRFAGRITSFAAAQQLAKWLYPDDFADLDPEAGLREFHERFMPIEYSGTWMVELEAD